MAGFVMNKFSLLLPFVLSFAACNNGAPTAVEEPPLAGARIGGPFTLTDQDGKPFSSENLKGKYSLIYFGYTYCPDVCPVDLQHMMAGFRLFEKSDPDRAAKIQPVFITVDPARDTVENVKKFVGQFHPRLIGLTGTDAQIAEAAKAYVVQYHKVENSNPENYLMAHTQLAYLMDPDGKPVALIPTDDISTPNANEGEPQKVAAELARWTK